MNWVPLCSLETGEEGVVAELKPPHGALEQDLLLRLAEIGFLPGERLRIVARTSPGGESIAVRLGHATFALRRFEAALVGVQREGHPACTP